MKVKKFEKQQKLEKEKIKYQQDIPQIQEKRVPLEKNKSKQNYNQKNQI